MRWLRAAGDDVDEGLSGREAADWCGSDITVREVTRLPRLVHGFGPGYTVNARRASAAGLVANRA